VSVRFRAGFQRKLSGREAERRGMMRRIGSRTSAIIGARGTGKVFPMYSVLAQRARNGRGVFTAALTVAVFRASENKFLRALTIALLNDSVSLEMITHLARRAPFLPSALRRRAPIDTRAIVDSGGG